MTRRVFRGLAAAAFALTSGWALAQAAGPKDPNMPDPKNVPAEKIKPDMSTSGTTGSNLSEKLEKSDGVIKPPSNVDPDMAVRAPVPNPGTTPVIPPPGSPGGNPRLDPK